MSLKRPLSLIKLPSHLRSTTCRHLHRLNAPIQSIPKPTPFVPDVQTFLTLIGRGLSQHAAKIPSWEALFSLSSEQLRESGIEPARTRRYLLWWRERFRNGLIGVGGDMKHVKDGVGELQVVQVPSSSPEDAFATLAKDAGMKKVVVNTEPSERQRSVATTLLPAISASEVVPVEGVAIAGSFNIAGRGVEPVKGRRGVARLKVQEGLWEQKRGHKVDGGERRKAEVRAKRRAQERKDAR